MKKIVIVGVGLIGGSFALALKEGAAECSEGSILEPAVLRRTTCTGPLLNSNLNPSEPSAAPSKTQRAATQIVGMGRSRSSLERALQLGIIDVIGDEVAEAMDGADVVLIAAPVAQTEAILTSIYPYLQPQTIVTDAGSTKCDVVEAARRALKEKIAQFVPAHPIAGRESNGPEAAIPNLYQGKKVVITALLENSSDSINVVTDAWQRCGAELHFLTPEEHDYIFAGVSHLPHLLAYALVDQITKQPKADLRFEYAASGFRDFTRIAGSSPEMWRDISLANRDALLVELAHYQKQLQEISTALKNSDGNQLWTMFSNAQAARQRWMRSIETADPPKEK